MTTTAGTEPTVRPPSLPDGHRWETAGDAWGRRAADWAAFYEHYATSVLQVAFERLGIGPGTRLLDVACGSGLAIRLAHAAGADAAGIDAAERLVAIARSRTPEADVRVGTMFELPWPDGSFDAVSSINGIWGGCEGAVAEAHRVLRPDGRIAVSFWGRGHLDLRPCFKIFAANSPEAHQLGMRRTNDIARPGVAEKMLEEAGFVVLERGMRVSTVEWPDPDTAWRAISSAGPAQPALEAVGADALRPQVMAFLDTIVDEHGLYRFRNDQEYVIGEKRA